MKTYGRIFSSLLAFALYVLLCGCGGGGGGGGGSSPPQAVSGVAATGLPLAGTITLQDSSAASKQLTATTAADGSFTLDVSGLTAPYLLRATGTADGTSYTLYSLATGPGTCNINPLTDLAVTMANNGQEPTSLFNAPSTSGISAVAAKLSSALTSMQTQLTPLFNQVGISPSNIITDPYVANNQGIDLLLAAITISVANGDVTIVNSSSGATILPATSISGGTFNGTVNVSALALYTISGTVTNTSSAAIAGVTVTLAGSSSTTATTDANGNFTFAGVPNGSYALSAALSGYSFSPARIPIVVTNANLTGENFAGSVAVPTLALVSIAVTPATPSIAVGATQQFKATGTYSDNSTQDLTASVTWSSSKTSVVTITTGGNATMVTVGSATITAASGTISGTATLTSTTGAISIFW